MATNGKVVINLATGLEDPERVTVAFLVAGAAAQAGKQVTMFLTKEAVRLALPDIAQGIACDGCPTAADTRGTVRRGRRADARLPDLLRRTKAQPAGPDRRRTTRRRHPAVAMDRRRRHRLQLLTRDKR